MTRTQFIQKTCDNIARERTAQRMSITCLAERSGLTTQTVHAVEKHRSSTYGPSIGTLFLFAQALGKTVKELLPDDE